MRSHIGWWSALALGGGALLALPATVSAQDHGHVAGVIGATFQSQTDGVFGGEIAANVLPNLQIYGGMNIMRNVLPPSVQDDLDDLGDALTTFTGTLWGFNATARAVTGVGGVRLRLPTGRTWAPYVVAGAGVAHVSLTIKETNLGDITDIVLEEMGSDASSTTRPFFELGGGLAVPIGALFIDAGYRYGRIVDDDGLNTSRVHFSVGARF